MGGVDNVRQPVDYGKAFAAYCHAEPAARPEIPAYLSAFTFPVEFRYHLETTGSTRDYHGPVGVPSIKWDIDRVELCGKREAEARPDRIDGTSFVTSDQSLDAALHDCRRLASFLADRYCLDANDLLIGFSGSKGFHVELPISWSVEASPDANMVCHVFAERIAHEVGVVIDNGIYDRVRAFRAWNSLHPRTGLHKIRINLDDLLFASVDWIKHRAVEPIPFDPPIPSPCPLAEADWRQAEIALRRQVEERQARRAGSNDTGKLNALTRQLIVEPTAIEIGERHRRLFSAAANLAEMGAEEGLIFSLLAEPGLDTGLPPREVVRQIRTGIEHARRQKGEGGADA
jgi:hypothetical protein